MDMNWMQKIASYLTGGKTAEQPGLQNAAQGLDRRAYELYAAEARGNGQTPVSPQQFAAGQLQAQQPAAQPAQPAAEPPPFRF
jgi:hypothetical protein